MRILPSPSAAVPRAAAVALALAGLLAPLRPGLALATGDPRPRHEWEPEAEVLGPLTDEEFRTLLPFWELRAAGAAPEAEVVGRLAEAEPALIEVVFGTWCRASYAHVPGLVAALRAAGNEGLRLALVAVDRGGNDPGGAARRLRAEELPTVVVSRAGGELGRVVGTPAATLERDVANILGAVRLDVPPAPEEAWPKPDSP